jgi:hypothetical protein
MEKEKKLKIARPPAANTRYTKKEEGGKRGISWSLLFVGVSS